MGISPAHEKRASNNTAYAHPYNFPRARIYVSALSWLMPEIVGNKAGANLAYSVSGGEYVVDIDENMFWRLTATRLSRG